LKIEGRLARFLIALGFPILKLWIRTLRFEMDDRGGIQKFPTQQRFICALWHNRLLLIAHAIWRFFPERRGGACLISASRDGAIIADIVERYGFRPVRGSSSRKGPSALLQLADMIASGRDALITPDGPRGPVYELGDGIIFLAQKTGAPVVPASMEYSGYWRVKSWDRFFLPKPFSKVRLIFGQPVSIGSTSTDSQFEAERVRLQKEMMALVETR
jgi:lysophospholipid acyltransferase (LPLAT)-like uncharacterized protein